MNPVSGGTASAGCASSMSRSIVLPEPCDPRMKNGDGTTASDPAQHRRVELVDASQTGQRHRQVELGEQAAQHMPYAVLATDAETVDIRTAEEDTARAERNGLHHVAAGADARVEQHGHPIPD